MSAKNLDRQNRWRNKTIAFRMSPEEAEQLDVNVRLSGLSKQDYLIWRVLQREIKVVGNPRVYKALKNTMAEVLEELRRIGVGENVSEHQPKILISLKLSRHDIVRLLDGQHLSSHHPHIACHGRDSQDNGQIADPNTFSPWERPAI